MSGVKIGYINDTVKTMVSSTTFPSRISIAENSHVDFFRPIYGKGKGIYSDRKASLTLDFSYFSEANLRALRDVLNNSAYDKKIIEDSPSLIQEFDHGTHGGDNIINWALSDTDFSGGTVSETEFTSDEYDDVSQIDSSYYEKAQSSKQFTYIRFKYDLSAFIAAYGAAAIQRLTFMLHNPYCINAGSPAPYRMMAWAHDHNNVGYWFEIGEETYPMADADLRAAGLMNQQFYQIKKTAGFRNIADCLTSGVLNLAMVNSNARGGSLLQLGFNYAGLFVNGYACKLASDDSWTYQESYDGSGFTGSLEFQEL